MQTVSKSSKDCEAYNLANKDAIDLGVMEAIQPDERILKHEREIEVVRAEGKAQAMAGAAILERVLEVLRDSIGENYRIYYPHADNYMEQPSLQPKEEYGPTVRCEHFRGAHYNYYWRVDVGIGYKDHKYIKLGEKLEASVEQVKKIAAALQEKHAANIQRNFDRAARERRYKSEQTAKEAGSALFNEDETTFKSLGLSRYSDISVVGGEATATVTLTLTHDEWKEIADIVNHAKERQTSQQVAAEGGAK